MKQILIMGGIALGALGCVLFFKFCKDAASDGGGHFEIAYFSSLFAFAAGMLLILHGIGEL